MWRAWTIPQQGAKLQIHCRPFFARSSREVPQKHSAKPLNECSLEHKFEAQLDDRKQASGLFCQRSSYADTL